MFHNICTNLNSRLKIGMNYGFIGCVLTLGVVWPVSTGIYALVYKYVLSPYQEQHNEYVKSICIAPECFYGGNPYRITSCNSTYSRCEDLNLLVKNYDNNLQVLTKYDITMTSIKLILPISLSIGFALGFAYGFFWKGRNAAAQNPAALPLLENAVQERKSDRQTLTNQERCKKLRIKDEEIPEEFKDPAHKEMMNEPVILPCGHGHDKSTVNRINKCTLCRKTFNQAQIVTNFPIRNSIETFFRKIEKQTKDLESENEPGYQAHVNIL